MKVYLTNQAYNFEKLLGKLIAEPTMVFSKSDLKEQVSTISIAGPGNLSHVNLDFLFDYQVFPSNIMSHYGQWRRENRRMRVGDTILQQVFIPPVRTFSQKVVFGVRINSIIDEVARKGFSYETLQGHVEKGESTFTVEQTGGGLIFKIQTFSEPGNRIAKLFGSFFTWPYQKYCTRKALEHVSMQLESQGYSINGSPHTELQV